MTARGVQPVCTFQQVFEYKYLFGAFSPVSGDQFQLEMPFCNTETFQIFLDEFSKRSPEEFKIIVLDNGAFHKSRKLKVPDNIALLFLPPYSPELNPAEKIWQHIKRRFTNQLFRSLEEVSTFFSQTINSLSAEMVKSICGYEYIDLGSFWSA